MFITKPRLLIITNLYPWPWQPNRATFNYQQFEHLEQQYDISIVVPVAWPDYLKNRKKIKQSDKVKYVPYFYTPKIGRQYYGLMMYLSIQLFLGTWLLSKPFQLILGSWAFPEGDVVKRLAKHLQIPYFIKVHGTDVNAHEPHSLRANLIKSACNESNGVIAVSQALKNRLIDFGVEPQKINVIYNGVNKDRFLFQHRKPKERLELLFVGNLKREKGVMELLEAVEILSHGVELHLTVVGSGAIQSETDDFCKKMNISHLVSFTGVLDSERISLLMQDSDFTVLPSYSEGVPNVLLESMSCGTPVVATNVGGIPEIVKQQQGVLCDPKSTSALVDALTSAIKSPWNRTAIAQHAAQFDWDLNIQQISDVLSKAT